MLASHSPSGALWRLPGLETGRAASCPRGVDMAAAFMRKEAGFAARDSLIINSLKFLYDSKAQRTERRFPFIGRAMHRQKALLKHISKTARGVEIGPYFSPLAPKREGFNCLSLDVFDTESIRRRASGDPNLSPENVELIENVDLVGSAVKIDEICRANGVDELDYIVSSHNFEHLPNPIAFLQACGRILKPGGYLSMAVPDKRACFDFFRSRTSLSAWIEAYFEGRERPTHAQVFDQDGLIANLAANGRNEITFFLHEDLEKISVAPALREAFDVWTRKREAGDENYYDVHCWTFTPSSCRALLSDLHFLGLSPFLVEEVTDTAISEFFVHLKLVGYKSFSEEECAAHYAARAHMLRAAVSEDARASNRREFEVFEHFRVRYRRIGWNAPVVLVRAAAIFFRCRNLASVKHYLAIRNSVFFDPDFYARSYGVAGDGASHYLLEGAEAGFDPGPFFSTRKYLEMNLDVAGDRVNPLAHYELFGRPEGRKPALS